MGTLEKIADMDTSELAEAISTLFNDGYGVIRYYRGREEKPEAVIRLYSSSSPETQLKFKQSLELVFQEIDWNEPVDKEYTSDILFVVGYLNVDSLYSDLHRLVESNINESKQDTLVKQVLFNAFSSFDYQQKALSTFERALEDQELYALSYGILLDNNMDDGTVYIQKVIDQANKTSDVNLLAFKFMEHWFDIGDESFDIYVRNAISSLPNPKDKKYFVDILNLEPLARDYSHMLEPE